MTRLVLPLRFGSGSRNSTFLTDLLSVRNERLVAGIPNRPEVAVSDSGCRAVRLVRLALPWFVPWDTASKAAPWKGALPPKVIAVRWHNDTTAVILVSRAIAKAKFGGGANVAGRELPPATGGPWYESVFVAFDPRSGRVYAEVSRPGAGFQFLSANEVVDAWSDGYRIHRLELVPAGRPSSSPVRGRAGPQ